MQCFVGVAIVKPKLGKDVWFVKRFLNDVANFSAVQMRQHESLAKTCNECICSK